MSKYPYWYNKDEEKRKKDTLRNAPDKNTDKSNPRGLSRAASPQRGLGDSTPSIGDNSFYADQEKYGIISAKPAKPKELFDYTKAIAKYDNELAGLHKQQFDAMIYGRENELNELEKHAAEAKKAQDSLWSEYNVAMGTEDGGAGYWEQPRWGNGGKVDGGTTDKTVVNSLKANPIFMNAAGKGGGRKSGPRVPDDGKVPSKVPEKGKSTYERYMEGQGEFINGVWWPKYKKGKDGKYIEQTKPDTSDPTSIYYMPESDENEGPLEHDTSKAEVPSEDSSSVEVSSGSALVDAAKKYLGETYYKEDGETHNVDCSRLVKKALKDCGIEMHGSSNTMAKTLDEMGYSIPIDGEFDKDAERYKIDESILQPGDLLFYRLNDSREGDGLEITHVAIYMGNGQILHSTPSGNGVHIEDEKYKENWGLKQSEEEYKNEPILRLIVRIPIPE